MQTVADRAEASGAIQTDLRAIFVSLELSRSTWLITSLSPGGGEKLSKHSVPGRDVAGLLERFAQLRDKARARTGKVFPLIVIQEAGLDGFWIHRILQSEGIESHVVDPASIATSRRRRRAKTDRIDGEALVRALLAYKRGEPRVCNGQGAHTAGGRPPSCLPGAQGVDRGAGPARQPRQGAAVLCTATGGSD
jgi:transposase